MGFLKAISVLFVSLMFVGCATVGYTPIDQPDPCTQIDHTGVNSVMTEDEGGFYEIGRTYDEMCNIMTFYKNDLTNECFALIGIPALMESGQWAYIPAVMMTCEEALGVLAGDPEQEELTVELRNNS